MTTTLDSPPRPAIHTPPMPTPATRRERTRIAPVPRAEPARRSEWRDGYDPRADPPVEAPAADVVAALRCLIRSASLPRDASAEQPNEGTIGPRAIARVELDEALFVLLEVPIGNRERLTRREVEVAFCIGEGLRNREIAARLDISAATVAAHVRNIFRKLRVRTRTECARWVLTDVGVASS